MHCTILKSGLPGKAGKWGHALERYESASVGSRAGRILLVPTDGSRIAMQGAEYVARHADAATRIHVVNVQPPIMAGDVGFVVSAAMVAQSRRSAGEEAMLPATRLFGASRIRYTASVLSGPVAESIVRCAVARGCTDIVMGTKSRGVMASLLRPSVAAQVARLAPMPVTLVKENGAGARAARRWEYGKGLAQGGGFA